MIELIAEILIYLIAAALIGLILGFLIWGWGRRRAIAAARAEGASSVRTSVDGDSSLRSQLEACARSNARLEESAERHRARIAELEAVVAEQQRSEPSLVPEPKIEAPQATAQVFTDVAAPASPEKSAIAEINDDDPFSRRLAGFGSDEGTDRHETTAMDTTADHAPNTLPAEGSEPEPSDTVEPDAEPTPAVTESMPPQSQEPAPVPKSLLSERPDEVDDLKRIKGVGPVMEQVLNEKGVYLFRQVANFSQSDVAWVNSAIDAFPGRIDRDNWVGQAQQLYGEKYGRSYDEPD